MGNDGGGRRELSASPTRAWSWRFVSATASSAASYGEPLTDEGGRRRSWCWRMGKLGGEELNFSSDVDVCYFYSTDAGAGG